MIGPERLTLSIPISVGDASPSERVRRAAAAGYRVLESWWPWAVPVPTAEDRDEFVGAVHAAGARLELLNLTEGQPGTGGRGIAGRAGDDEVFAAHAASVVELAASLGVRWINALAGNTGPEGTAAGREVLRTRLRAVAALASPHGIGLVLEPLNRADHPDYLLDPAEVPALVHELRVEGLDVAVLADVYHLTRAGADPAAFIVRHADLIGHVQVADHPGRGRPGSGRIDFAGALAALDAVGYEGMIGLEHRPDGRVPTPEAAWRGLVSADGTAREEGAGR